MIKYRYRSSTKKKKDLILRITKDDIFVSFYYSGITNRDGDGCKIIKIKYSKIAFDYRFRENNRINQGIQFNYLDT
ncbi:hypothetical protein BpHYR1_033726 [Brachionus plicatilis]|uniref:Uncharacterized protein n=1 Tax=Brachionus plicatilis TaxID=10195 RepID=A0A3M7Q2T3_BRAPC|nr:hypothetical protein BpHYR1_033726 [Brachionus plicatilis]